MGNFPLRHLSIRVPWHDSGWKGVICQAPHLNGACVKLKGITDKKNDEQECKIAGRSLDDLPAQDLPPCVNERGFPMASFELEPIKRHALAHMNPDVTVISSQPRNATRLTRQVSCPFGANS